MRHWLDMDRSEIAAFLAENRLPAYRAKQLWDWLHGKRADSFDAMSNLPASLRRLLAREGALRVLGESERLDAPDALTSKWLFLAPDAAGAGTETPGVESVLIIEKTGSRRTVCVSSMIGCPLACAFCATGGLGFVRNLAAGEILEQVYRLDTEARRLPDGLGVSHVVFMGMGEPLLTLDAVVRAAAVLTDPGGLGLSGRHLTISTAGVPDGIRRLAELGLSHRLAVSLHAPNQAVRERLMPCARRWPLTELWDALERFAATASRDITFEYCLIDGVNASPGDARELADLLGRFRCKVNLIPMNPVPGNRFRPPAAAAVRRFQTILQDAGVPATLRTEKGAEIGAACGQLGARRVRKQER